MYFFSGGFFSKSKIFKFPLLSGSKVDFFLNFFFCRESAKLKLDRMSYMSLSLLQDFYTTKMQIKESKKSFLLLGRKCFTFLG